jgi:hypothetical protein
MKTLLKTAWIAGLVLSLVTGFVHAAAEPPSPLISAEPLGSVSYDTLVGSLQAKIDRSNDFDQGWFQTLWTWVCYILHDILHDPWLAEYVKITYWTTTASGDRIQVTGLAILPRNNYLHETVPMISFQHPTQIERRFSPSMFNMTNMWDDAQFTVPFGTIFAQSGFAVAMADYPGMGSNTNVHPYCTESLANSVVDMIRATRDYLKANTNTYAQWDSRLYLTGYSEGGYATVMAARDLQGRYASEFTNVLGVAGLDGPYSLSDTMRKVMLTADTTFSSPYFLPYTVNGYDSVYAAVDPVFVFTNAIKASVPTEQDFAGKLQRMCIAGTNSGDEMNALIYKATPYVGPRSILTDSYVAQLSNTASTLNRVLASNDAYYAWTPQSKMRLYHYPKDDLVPYGNSTNAYIAFTNRHAAQTELVTYASDGVLSLLIEWLKSKMSSYHGAAAPVAYVMGITWLHDLAYGHGNEFQFPPNDLDGDGFSDMVLYSEAGGTWQVLLSNRTASWRKPNPNPAPMAAAQIALGGPGFTPLLEDFDGDGKVDPCVYHPASGLWTIQLSLFEYVPLTFLLGDAGSTPVPQDYDGDRLADPAVYQSATGGWTVYRVFSNRFDTVHLGGTGFSPVDGDYDADRKADLVVYEEATGKWIAALSGNNYASVDAVCGGPGFTPVPGDYDGDGRTDPAVYNGQAGSWQVMLSDSGYAKQSFSFGGPGFAAVAGDYDADKKIDIMVYHENSGLWNGMMSSNNYRFATGFFGGNGLHPVQ